MDYKKIFLSVLIIFCLILSASIVSASDDTVDVATAEGFSSDEVLVDDMAENTADSSEDTEVMLTASADAPDNIEATTYKNATIISNDVYTSYPSEDNYQITVIDRDTGKLLAYKKLQINIYSGTVLYSSFKGSTNATGIYEGGIYQSPGTYKVVVSLNDTTYKADNTSFNIFISKAPVDMVVSDITGTYPYATLKVTLKNSDGSVFLSLIHI